MFAFMIGADVGDVGDREFQSQTIGQFAKNVAHYRALEHEIELEFVPAGISGSSSEAASRRHDINGVPDFEDRRQFGLQGVSPLEPTSLLRPKRLPANRPSDSRISKKVVPKQSCRA